jgi:hypothetical protein
VAETIGRQKPREGRLTVGRGRDARPVLDSPLTRAK